MSRLRLLVGACAALAIAGSSLVAEQSRLSAPAPLDDKTVIHVLNRLGFGPTPPSIEHVRRVGLDAYINEQLHPNRIPDAGVAGKLARLRTLDKTSEELAREYFLPALLLRGERQRRAAGGASPDMDLPDPRPQVPRRGLNENYARELMELHTLGVQGGYTQNEVQEVARALTGWTIANPRRGGGFRFDPRLHDDGEKIVLGHRIKAEAWVNTGALLNRMNFAIALAGGRLPGVSAVETGNEGAARDASRKLIATALGGDVSETTASTVARAETARQSMALILGRRSFRNGRDHGLTTDFPERWCLRTREPRVCAGVPRANRGGGGSTAAGPRGDLPARCGRRLEHGDPLR